MQNNDTYYIQPAQLGLRFTLEVVAIIAYAVLGWSFGGGFMALLNAILIPSFFMTVWGVFNVPGDRSRSAVAIVPVKGWVRLLLELGVFAGAGFAMYATGKSGLAAIFLTVTAIHYLTTLSRMKWLLAR